jgi:hypothetical protein
MQYLFTIGHSTSLAALTLLTASLIVLTDDIIFDKSFVGSCACCIIAESSVC